MILSIVTLNYKRHELTIACLQSLWAQFQNEFLQDKIELIIVDNDSQDDSVTAITQEITNKGLKNVQVIANDTNAGFGAGNNKGAAAANGEYILFLNNDTEVKDQGVFEMTHYMATHPEIGILGGQLHNPDGSLQSSGGSFYTLWPAFFLLLGVERFFIRNPKQIKKVDWVKGGLLMIRREVFKRLGGFDEKIFMYIEDMELCYRASSAGYTVYLYPNVNVIHKEHGSGDRSFAIVNIYKNLLYFYQKHRSHTEYVIMRAMLTSKAKCAILVGKLFKQQALIDTYQKALAAI